MCSGAIYWAGIGTVVYGLDEVELLKLTGDDLKNPTMSLDCRKVLNSGQREIKVIGPFNDLYDECVESHKGYWKK